MKTLFVLFLIYHNLSEGAILTSIPEHLRECYRRGGPSLAAPKRLDVFLSLLKKLELNSRLDVRMLSTGLLRSLRLDGIEEAADLVETDFILPYRASAFQFYKYQLLMNLFVPSQENFLRVDEILSSTEKCLLHKMISSSVQPWERGDESTVCPLSVQQRQNVVLNTNSSVRMQSRCPIEEGVIQTEWGTISPGTLISALASALEPQRVLVTDILNANIFKEDIAEPLMESAIDEWLETIETLDTEVNESRFQRQASSADISNVWAATLAGDLAEVVVNQGPRVGASSQRLVVGTSNRWNDTILPRVFYVLTQNTTVDWHFTDAEILAGVDGLILANYLPKWIEERPFLKLSQVLDMYYSHEGVSFDTSVKACNRQTLFSSIFNSSQLFIETSRFAHVLSLRQITVYIPLEEMNAISQAAVAAFMGYIQTVLRQHQTCQISNVAPEIDLIVATDGSWRGYDVEKFMSWVGNALEIDLQRSTIALLHGNTAEWIVEPSHNLTSVFTALGNANVEWPTRLNLPNVISRVIRHSENKTLLEIASQASAGPSTVILIISPSDRPSNTELERARELMTSLRTNYFDVYFAYAAQELTDFQNINNEYLDYSELFLSTASVNVQDVITSVDTYLVKSDVPTRIMGVQCPFNGTVYNQTDFEDFVIPGREKNYRVHPYYLRMQNFIQFQFRNQGQGQLLVCMWRGADASHTCQTIPERGVQLFNVTTPCPSPDFCPPLHFIVTAISTLNECAHDECRLPNQLGYYIRHEGLRCLPLKGSTDMLAPSRNVHLWLSLMISLLLISD